MKNGVTILGMFLAMILLIPLAGYTAGENELVENIGNGSINWSNGLIQSTGIGAPPENFYGKPGARPMAIRAAKLDALRNLLEVINGVRIDSKTTIKDFAVESDIIETKVSGMVRGAEEVKTEYMSDGTVEVVMQVKMNGGFSQLVLPQDIKQIEPIKTISPTKAPVSDPLTGLLVDARGLGVKPAMAPKIMNEDGEEVYGAVFVSREYAVQQGVSGYCKNIDTAPQNARIADNPLLVKGLRTNGPGGCDIIISNADASRLKNAAEHLDFLKKCRVMIVVD